MILLIGASISFSFALYFSAQALIGNVAITKRAVPDGYHQLTGRVEIAACTSWGIFFLLYNLMSP